MLLGEPPRTQFDLHFVVSGVSVRVHPFFWLVALLLGSGLVGNDGVRYVLWITAMFLSILIHELGHALAFRRFGIASHIVLYHFGGLAIPDTGSSPWSSGRSLKPNENIFVSAAGPGAQLLLAAFVMLAFRASGYMVTYPGSQIPFSLPFVRPSLIWGNAVMVQNALLNDFALFLLWPSVWWALLNLLPVYPLDGGQIAREVLVQVDPWDGVRKSLWLSVFTGGVLAFFGLSNGMMFLGIMFGMLAYSSWQILQQISGGGGPGGWGGRRPW